MQEQLKQCPLIQSLDGAVEWAPEGGCIELLRLEVPRCKLAKLETVLRLAASALDQFHICFTDLSVSAPGPFPFDSSGASEANAPRPTLKFSLSRARIQPRTRPVAPSEHKGAATIFAECHQNCAQDLQSLRTSLLRGVLQATI